MHFFSTFIVCIVLFGAFANAEEIYSRKVAPNFRLVVSLSPEQIDHQEIYDLKLAPLPISISEAGEAALIEEGLHRSIKTDRVDVESVECKQYKAPTGQSDFGKFFYLVTLRSIVHHPKKDKWSFSTRWAVFPGLRRIKWVEGEAGGA